MLAILVVLVSWSAVGLAHWVAVLDVDAGAATGSTDVTIEGDLDIDVDGCAPGAYDTRCHRFEDGDLTTLPELEYGVGTFRVLEWIDKIGEPGGHVGVTFVVVDAVADVTITWGNPAKPRGGAVTLERIEPGVHTWLNPSCADGPGGASCTPASTSAITHIETCITAEVGASCPAVGPLAARLSNPGSVPLDTTITLSRLEVTPSIDDFCATSRMFLVITRDGEPVPISSGDLCDIEGTEASLGVVDPGEVVGLSIAATPLSTMGATHNGTSIGFDLELSGAVWTTPGTWSTAETRPVTLSIRGDPLSIAPPPPPPDPPAEEPPAEEPPDEPPAEEPPADEPPADEPPADEPPADEPPAEEPPAEEPPVESLIGYVTLPGLDEHIEGTAASSGTQNLSLLMLVRVADWASGEPQILFSHWGSKLADRSFLVTITEDGELELSVYDRGFVSFTTDPVDYTDGEWRWLRIDLDAAAGPNRSQVDVFSSEDPTDTNLVDIDWGDPDATITKWRTVTRHDGAAREFKIGGHGRHDPATMDVAYVALSTAHTDDPAAAVFASDWRFDVEFTGDPPTRPDDLTPGVEWVLVGHDIGYVAPPIGVSGVAPYLLAIVAVLPAAVRLQPLENSAGAHRRTRDRNSGRR